MLLKLLRQALSDRRRNIEIARRIQEGKGIRQISVTPVTDDVELELEPRWWLEKFFDKVHLSFSEGVLVIYALIEIPRLLLLPSIIGRAQEYFVIGYVSSFFGEMFIPIALLLIHSVYKGLVELKSHMNKVSRAKKFVAPLILVSEKELASKDSMADLDQEYRNRYIKPVMLKTLQHGLNLSFNRGYQLGSGAVAVSLFFLIMVMRFVINVIPPNVFMILEPGVPEIAFAYIVVVFYILAVDWFLVGMLTWTLFVTFLLIIQASGNAIGIRPFESIKGYFEQATTLTLKTSFTVTFLVAWMSPFLLVWSVLPPDPLYRQAAAAFVGSLLILMIPIIILSFFLPILKIHKGMEESRKKALVIKRYQLEDIEKFRESNLDKYFMIRKHLIDDYKDIQRNPEWVLNITQTVEIAGTVFLPIITFLISISV